MSSNSASISTFNSWMKSVFIRHFKVGHSLNHRGDLVTITPIFVKHDVVRIISAKDTRLIGNELIGQSLYHHLFADWTEVVVTWGTINFSVTKRKHCSIQWVIRLAARQIAIERPKDERAQRRKLRLLICQRAAVSRRRSCRRPRRLDWLIDCWQKSKCQHE